MRFRISKSRDGQFYFEIQLLGNYEAIATSERFRTKAACMLAIDHIKAGAAAGSINDQSGG
jgi:uncharacterized protein YegP (UPF0339 family)